MRSLIALILFTALAQAQLDQKKAEARRLYSEGQSAFDAGDFQTAYDRFNDCFHLTYAPELLFKLRHVDERDLIARAGKDIPLAKDTPKAARILDDGDLSALFDLEMTETTTSDIPSRRKPSRMSAAKQPPTPEPTPAKKTVTSKKTSMANTTESSRAALASTRQDA